MSDNRPVAVIVLAAGQGTRMKSARPKVLHALAGRSLLHHALAAAAGLDPEHLVVVLRHDRDRVAAHVAELAGPLGREVTVADQDEVPGTGRAAQVGLEVLPVGLAGTVVVTYGDVPLLTTETLRGLVADHERHGNAVTVLTARVPDPTGYGRIVRAAGGEVLGIVEHKDASPEQLAIDEINSGIYAFDARVLRDCLSRVGRDNAQGEKYLTDVLDLARAAGGRVAALPAADRWQIEGVNDRVQLARLRRVLNERVTEAWMRAGVTIEDPATTWIDCDVELAADVTVHPGCQLQGATRVEAGAEIGPDSTLADVTVGAGAHVVRTHGSQAGVGAGASVGPFSYLRPGTVLGADGKIGAYVETKNAQIGPGAKVPHLTYAGDVVIGEGTNVGAGTIFANYDGVHKFHTTIGAHAFVGSHSTVVAPVSIGDGAYTAAGSAIVEDVPAGALGVARGRQHVSPGWTAKRRPGTASAAAAEAAGEPDD